MSSPIRRLYIMVPLGDNIYRRDHEEWLDQTLGYDPARTYHEGTQKYKLVAEIEEHLVVENPELVLNGAFIYDPERKMFQRFEEIT